MSVSRHQLRHAKELFYEKTDVHKATLLVLWGLSNLVRNDRDFIHNDGMRRLKDMIYEESGGTVQLVAVHARSGWWTILPTKYILALDAFHKVLRQQNEDDRLSRSPDEWINGFFAASRISKSSQLHAIEQHLATFDTVRDECLVRIDAQNPITA